MKEIQETVCHGRLTPGGGARSGRRLLFYDILYFLSRTPPIPRSALEKDPRPGPLFEGNPVGEGTTRRGTATPANIHCALHTWAIPTV